MTEERTLSSHFVYKGRALRLRIDAVETAGGRDSRREIVEHEDCVAIIAVNGDSILLVRQFRKPVEQELLEIPAGGINPGESPEEAVSRELREETGYLPQKIERLGGFYSIPGYGTEYLYLYLATDLTPGRLFAEDTESISVVPVPVNQILDLIASGNICDAKSIAGLLTFQEYLKRGNG
ncbi:MAG: NUDIX hydrolase [Dehalococcoidales bacterium]|nr:NUDIX hydrolase [Dehalococcoidales bacterium]